MNYVEGGDFSSYTILLYFSFVLVVIIILMISLAAVKKENK